MRVFKTKSFQRFARKEGIADSDLCEAVFRAGVGLVDADLGAGVIKQRVACRGEGRSGGFRTIIAYRSGKRSVFILGFSKSSQDNIGDEDLRRLQKAAESILNLNDREIDELVADKKWIEVACDA